MTPPASHTVGVGEEFLLLRRTGTALRPVGEAVADDAEQERTAEAGDAPTSRFEHELEPEQAELGSAPTDSLAALERDLVQRRDILARGAARHDARLVASGTSPLVADATTTADERYERMTEVFRRVATVQLTCGMHVHVAVDSREEGVVALDGIAAWLPALLTLSANSPWWQGVDTGYDSYRTVVWGNGRQRGRATRPATSPATTAYTRSS